MGLCRSHLFALIIDSCGLVAQLSNIDLTTLAGDDTPGNVARLCAKAKQPVKPEIIDALGVGHLNIKCGAVCVYPARVKDACAALKGTGIPVAAVASTKRTSGFWKRQSFSFHNFHWLSAITVAIPITPCVRDAARAASGVHVRLLASAGPATV